jgi:hypothetical protein
MLYKIARILNDVKAVMRSIGAGSLMPLVKRVVNKFVGRKIVSKLWWR